MSYRDLAHRSKETFTIVDMNHEFDDELSDDNSHEQEFKETNPKDKLSKRLQKTITEYEDLLNRDLFKDENEKQSAQKLLKTLKSQLDSHTTPKPLSKVPEESIEEKREKSLQELFSFYAKQHIPPGLPFEKLEETLQTINVGELVIFWKDFGIDLSRNELMLIYKKEAENNNPHKFKQFMQSLKKICELRHGKQIQKLKNRIKELNGLLGIKSIKNHQSEDEKSSEHSSEGEGEGSESEGDSDAKSKKSKQTQGKEDKKDAKANDKKGDKDINKKEPAKQDIKDKNVDPKNKKEETKDSKDEEKSKKEDPKSKQTEKQKDSKNKDKAKQSQKSKSEKASKASGNESEGEGSDSEGEESESENEGEGEAEKENLIDVEAEKNKLLEEKTKIRRRN